MLDIERWLEWIKEEGFRIVTPNDLAQCDICVKAKRGNSWMVKGGWGQGIDVTVCEEHGREYNLIW